jgi:hypothetical protein
MSHHTLSGMTRRTLGRAVGKAVGQAIGLSLLTGLLTLAGEARAADGPLQLAFYAPTAPLPSAEARYAFTEKLAAALSSSGVPVQTKIFARPQDFEAALKKGIIDLAVLDPVYAAERGASYPVLAIATAAGEAYLRWGLYTHEASGSILDMAGKRLAWVAPGGKDSSYIGNVLLYGELKTSFFQLRPAAPDMAAAVSEVVLAPRRLRLRSRAGRRRQVPAQGLRCRRRWPHSQPGAGASREPSHRRHRRPGPQGCLSFNATGLLDGFRATAAAAESIRSVRSKLRGRPERTLVLAEPSRLNTQVQSSMLSPPELSPATLPYRTLLAPPEGIP